MSATTELPMAVQLDAALDELERRRERVLAAGWDHPQRSVQLAGVYELEAALWVEVFERTRVRLYWRAALAAQAYARHCARQWASNRPPEVARLRALVDEHEVIEPPAWPRGCAERGERSWT